jgi:predicted DNA-binding transcriptional regulator AlpA
MTDRSSGARYLRKRAVLEVVPFGATTLWEKIKAGEFPPPVAYLSPRMPVWSASEVEAALDKMVAEAAARPHEVASVARPAREARRAGRRDRAARFPGQ